MKDWNLIVTTYQRGFRRALDNLRNIGATERSQYHNVLVMKVDDPLAVLTAVERLAEQRPALYDAIARVAPAMRTFDFQSSEAFKENAQAVMLDWVANLTGRTFHVRVHRRGPQLGLQTPDAERFCDDAVVDATTKAGTPARISFSDPDALIVIDTIDDRAGLAIWTREDLASHLLLHPD